MVSSKTRVKTEILQAALCAFAVLALCALPFANRDLAAGHDAIFHILRIESLAQAIRGGAGWPAPIYSLMLGGYGYAAGLFYPDLFLLPAALLRAFVLGPEMAFKFHMLLCVLAQCLTCYFAARAISKSHFGGCLFMVLYSLCQYHFANVFIRSAVGEVQAMVFMPLVVWGLWDFTENRAQKPWLLFLGFTGLVLSHTVSLAIMGIFAILWVLLRLNRVLYKEAILKGLAAAGACLAVSCYYWLPMLEQFGADKFKVAEEPLTCLAANTVSGRDLLDVHNFVGIGMGGILILLALFVVTAIHYRRDTAVGGWGFLLAGAAVILCTMSWFPWAKVDETPLTSIQFPWRLNALGQLLCCLGITLVLCRLFKTGKERMVCVAAAVLLSATNLVCMWSELPEAVNYHKEYFTGQRGETFYLVGAEWLPAGVDAREFAFEQSAQWTGPAGTAQGQYLPNGDFTFDFDGTAGLYGVPKLWYQGYSAWLAEAQGQRMEIPLHKDGAGRVELEIPENLPAGQITVSYTGTAVQHAANRISLAAAVALAVAAVLAGRKRKQFVKEIEKF